MWMDFGAPPRSACEDCYVLLRRIRNGMPSSCHEQTLPFDNIYPNTATYHPSTHSSAGAPRARPQMTISAPFRSYAGQFIASQTALANPFACSSKDAASPNPANDQGVSGVGCWSDPLRSNARATALTFAEATNSLDRAARRAEPCRWSRTRGGEVASRCQGRPE